MCAVWREWNWNGRHSADDPFVRNVNWMNSAGITAVTGGTHLKECMNWKRIGWSMLIDVITTSDRRQNTQQPFWVVRKKEDIMQQEKYTMLGTLSVGISFAAFWTLSGFKLVWNDCDVTEQWKSSPNPINLGSILGQSIGSAIRCAPGDWPREHCGRDSKVVWGTSSYWIVVHIFIRRDYYYKSADYWEVYGMIRNKEIIVHNTICV